MLVIALLMISSFFTSLSLYFILEVINISRSNTVKKRWYMLLSIIVIFFITIAYKLIQNFIIKENFNEIIVGVAYFALSLFMFISSATTYKTFKILYKEMDEKKKIQKRITEINRRLTMIIKKNKMKRKLK